MIILHTLRLKDNYDTVSLLYINSVFKNVMLTVT